MEQEETSVADHSHLGSPRDARSLPPIARLISQGCPHSSHPEMKPRGSRMGHTALLIASSHQPCTITGGQARRLPWGHTEDSRSTPESGPLIIQLYCYLNRSYTSHVPSPGLYDTRILYSTCLFFSLLTDTISSAGTVFSLSVSPVPRADPDTEEVPINVYTST